MKRAWLAPVIVALGALALAQGSSTAGNDVTVSQATVQGQTQQVLATSKGMTLYYSDKDTPDTSNCTGACAQNWKPYTISGTSVHVGSTSGTASTSSSTSGGSSSGTAGSSNGTAGSSGGSSAMGSSGLKSSDFSTITTNGKHQVVYKGHPLYTYSKDSKPGDAQGAGQSSFHVATPSTPKATAGSSGGTSSGGSSSGGSSSGGSSSGGS